MIKKSLLKKSKSLTVLVFLFVFYGNAQCPSTGVYTISSNINWTAIPGIATCSSSLTTVGSSFNGNVSISYSGANNNLTFNVNNLTINGNLNIQSTSNGNIFTIAPNTTLTIIGDLGDPANNNISYQLGSGSVLIVTGTLYGKNGNTIGGTGGTVSAGSVNFSPGNLECSGGGCPVLNITNCNDAGSACASNNATICTTNYGGSISGTQNGCSAPFDPSVLTLSGHTGRVLRWEKSINSGSTWTGLDSVSTTYNPPSITQTTIYRAVILNTTSGSCISYSNTTTVTVNALTAPTVGTRTQPTCAVATGSVVLNGLPASGTWTLTRSPGGVTTSGTGTSTTISGLAAGNYTYTVTNASGCISPASANVGINAFVAEINTWNANAWSTGSPPPMVNGTQIIVFNSPFISSTDLSGCSCEVNNDVLIKSGHTLTVTNELKVASGDMVFESGSSLVQKNDNVVNSNTGIIKYQRIARSLNTDYTYWSSPVSNQTLVGLIPTALAGTSYSYEQTATSENWVNAAGSTPMAPGKGYIIRGREGTQTIPKLNDVEFAGIPNNGPYSISPIYLDKSYLLGNPYPSAISADMFLAANAGVLNGTLYFWTHNTPIQAANAGDPTLGSGAYAYTSNDYATYNATGGVGAAPPDTGAATGPAPSGSTVSGANNSTPNGYISAGQGFFASTKISLSGSSIVFNNNMRVAGGTTLLDGSIVNDQFFKSRDPKKTPKNTIEKNRIWLNLTNKQGAFKQTLIGYISEATNEYDSRFDGKSYDGNEFVDFYSVNQDKNLVIQGRALPFDENDEVPLGFRTTINGAFTINIDQVDGFLTNQAVFIEDKLTNTVFDLKSGNYTFNTIAGTFDDRFVLRFKDNTTDKTLAAAYFDSLEKTVLVSNKNKQIRIDSAVERIDKVTVFDLLGRQIYQKTNVNSNELSITNLVISHQTLIVKTTLQNGNAVTRKIIY